MNLETFPFCQSATALIVAHTAVLPTVKELIEVLINMKRKMTLTTSSILLLVPLGSRY